MKGHSRRAGGWQDGGVADLECPFSCDVAQLVRAPLVWGVERYPRIITQGISCGPAGRYAGSSPAVTTSQREEHCTGYVAWHLSNFPWRRGSEVAKATLRAERRKVVKGSALPVVMCASALQRRPTQRPVNRLSRSNWRPIPKQSGGK